MSVSRQGESFVLLLSRVETEFWRASNERLLRLFNRVIQVKRLALMSPMSNSYLTMLVVQPAGVGRGSNWEQYIDSAS